MSVSTLQIMVLSIGVLALIGVIVSYIMRRRKPWTFFMSIFIVCTIFGVLSLVLG